MSGEEISPYFASKAYPSPMRESRPIAFCHSLK
jgi:hypothetical protein